MTYPFFCILITYTLSASRYGAKIENGMIFPSTPVAHRYVPPIEFSVDDVLSKKYSFSALKTELNDGEKLVAKFVNGVTKFVSVESSQEWANIFNAYSNAKEEDKTLTFFRVKRPTS